MIPFLGSRELLESAPSCLCVLSKLERFAENLPPNALLGCPGEKYLRGFVVVSLALTKPLLPML